MDFKLNMLTSASLRPISHFVQDRVLAKGLAIAAGTDGERFRNRILVKAGAVRFSVLSSAQYLPFLLKTGKSND